MPSNDVVSIEILKKNGIKLYPLTSVRAVVDNEGNTVEDIIDSKLEGNIYSKQESDALIDALRIELMTEINQKQMAAEALVFDTVPTEGSENVVRSGGIYNAIYPKVSSSAEDVEINNVNRTLLNTAIRKTEQVLTDVEKEQVKINLGGVLSASDVVNSLASTEPAKPLSANQGKILNETIISRTGQGLCWVMGASGGSRVPARGEIWRIATDQTQSNVFNAIAIGDGINSLASLTKYYLSGRTVNDFAAS